MGKNSAIAWTDHTFNPWVGCTKVSPGCKHCYAEALAKRSPALVHGRPQVSLPVWGDEAPRRVTSADYWKQPLRWDKAAAKAGKRSRVFCASLADLFENRSELIPHRFRLFTELIARTPNLDWLLLTKRPDQILRLWPSTLPGPSHWPNVWVGCTVEDQQRARERLPHLLQVPAPVRFVSYEPALEAVDFGPWVPHCAKHKLRAPCCGEYTMRRGIDWLIVGGESGAHARGFDITWARQAVARCRAAGVPVFVKQMGARSYDGTPDCAGRLLDPAGADPSEWPEDLQVQEWPQGPTLEEPRCDRPEHANCMPPLWVCPGCKKTMCMREGGTDNKLCDVCWADSPEGTRGA